MPQNRLFKLSKGERIIIGRCKPCDIECKPCEEKVCPPCNLKCNNNQCPDPKQCPVCPVCENCEKKKGGKF